MNNKGDLIFNTHKCSEYTYYYLYENYIHIRSKFTNHSLIMVVKRRSGKSQIIHDMLNIKKNCIETITI